MSDNRTDAPVSSFPTVLGYEIHAEERRDRLGVVYAARQLLYRREVALRLIDDRALGGERDLTALCRAAREASGLTHPNLVPLFEVGDVEGQVYLASDQTPGPSLRKRLAGAPLEPEETVRVVIGLARAVQHLHENHLLHLGLTSECVFLEGHTPFVGDLGLTELLHNHPGVPFPGNPAYAAPEQLAHKKADARADVYALGSILYECLTGRPLYFAATAELTARLAESGHWRGQRERTPGLPARTGPDLPQSPRRPPGPTLRQRRRPGRRPGTLPARRARLCRARCPASPAGSVVLRRWRLCAAPCWALFSAASS